MILHSGLGTNFNQVYLGCLLSLLQLQDSVPFNASPSEQAKAQVREASSQTHGGLVSVSSTQLMWHHTADSQAFCAGRAWDQFTHKHFETAMTRETVVGIRAQLTARATGKLLNWPELNKISTENLLDPGP